MRPTQGSAWKSEAKGEDPSEALTRTQEDAHREVLAIVEARTVVHGDAVTPGREESILTLTALRAGSGELHHFLNTWTGRRAGVHTQTVVAVGGAPHGCEEGACQTRASQGPPLC